jgi:hypothetical protein
MSITVSTITSKSSQIAGTTTNDNAPTGGIGEYVSSVTPSVNGTSATVTITNASPGIVSWTAHGMNIGGPVYFTTTGTLPTGLSPNTRYWVSSQSFSANSFAVSTTVDNALAGTSVNTSSAGSGTHTGNSSLFYGAADNSTGINLTGISLAAGDWDVGFQASFLPSSTVTTSFILGSITLVSGTVDLTDGRTGTFSYPAGSLIPNTMTASTKARLSLSGQTTVYGLVDWGMGTAVNSIVNGKLNARRVR